MIRLLARAQKNFILGTSLIFFSWILAAPINSFVDGNKHLGSIYCAGSALLHEACVIVYEPGSNLEMTKLPNELKSLHSDQDEVTSPSVKQIAIYGNIRDTMIIPSNRNYTSGLFYSFSGLFTHLGFEISILLLKLFNLFLIFIPFCFILKRVTRDGRNVVTTIYIIHILLQPILNFWLLTSLHPTSWLLLLLPSISTILFLLNSRSSFVSTRRNYNQLRLFLLCLLFVCFVTRRDSGFIVLFAIMSSVFCYSPRDVFSRNRISLRTLSLVALAITICVTLIYLSSSKLSIYTREYQDPELLFTRLLLLWNSKAEYLYALFGSTVNGEGQSFILNYLFRLNDTIVKLNTALFLIIFLISAIFARRSRETLFLCLAPYLVLISAFMYKVFTWEKFNIQYHQYAPYVQVCVSVIAISIFHSKVLFRTRYFVLAFFAFVVYFQSTYVFLKLDSELVKNTQRVVKFDYSIGDLLFSWSDNGFPMFVSITLLTFGYLVLIYALIQSVMRKRIDLEMV